MLPRCDNEFLVSSGSVQRSRVSRARSATVGDATVSAAAFTAKRSTGIGLIASWFGIDCRREFSSEMMAVA